ncbi:ABC transporter permease subunit [Halobaculum litoreum]|uniref:ABC transporter permease subunit n=1 Tax=Halobaculum litoreum TaxID=3031998 RepID=A0ABD5XV24_9EURY|nr:ABC transporter permease subunit [Halobaculum sp. DT92]
MLATARFEARQRLPGSVALSLGLAAFAALIVFLAPGLLGEVDLAAFVSQYPPALVERFDLAAIGTIEGFLALELYQFVWLLGLGSYVAYTAAGTIADAVETGRMDTVLAAPVSRQAVVVETFLALLVPVGLANVAVLCAVAAGTRVVGLSVPLADLVAVHALSVPYLLCCGAFGLLVSVVAPRTTLAEESPPAASWRRSSSRPSPTARASRGSGRCRRRATTTRSRCSRPASTTSSARASSSPRRWCWSRWPPRGSARWTSDGR